MSGTIDIDERIRMTMDAAEMAWWEMELPSGVVFFSDKKAELFGGKPEDFIHYSDFTNRLSTQEFEESMRRMQDHIDGKTKYYSTTYTVVGLDGVERTLYDRGRRVQSEEDGTIKLMGVLVDISEAVKGLKSSA